MIFDQIQNGQLSLIINFNMPTYIPILQYAYIHTYIQMLVTRTVIVLCFSAVQTTYLHCNIYKAILDYDDMLDTALSLNRNADIFITGLPRRWDDSKLNQHITSFNHYLELKAEKKPRLPYVKNDSYLQDKHYKKDGLHLNDIGTSQLACYMRSCLNFHKDNARVQR